MALLQNIRLMNAEPYRRFGDTSERIPQDLELYMNKYAGFGGFGQKIAIPNGYYPPYCFALPIKDGGEGLFTKTSGSGSVVATSRMATVKPFPVSVITGSGTISSAVVLSILWLLSDLAGDGEVSDTSDLKAFAFLGTDLAGAGEVDDSSVFTGLAWLSSLTDVAGYGNISSITLSTLTTMIANLQGSGEISSAPLLSLLWLLSNLSGGGEVDDSSDIKSFAFLNSSLTGAGEVDNTSIFASLIWLTLLADLSGSGDIDNIPMSLLTTMITDIEGSGTVSAGMKSLLILASSLSGGGEVDDSSLLKALTILNTSLTGNGTIEETQLVFYSWLLSNITGSGMTTGTMKGWADMGATITSAGELVTAQSCAQAVWNTIAADFNVSGTMGETLNSIARLTGNKVTKTGDIITIYEADGHTIWKQYNLASGGRVEV